MTQSPDPKTGHRWHDMGGNAAGPIPTAQHDFSLWEKRVDALMIIASGKAMLVLLYFMHVRFEKPVYALMIVAVFGTYAIFIGLTFVDYWYR